MKQWLANDEHTKCPRVKSSMALWVAQRTLLLSEYLRRNMCLHTTYRILQSHAPSFLKLFFLHLALYPQLSNTYKCTAWKVKGTNSNLFQAFLSCSTHSYRTLKNMIYLRIGHCCYMILLCLTLANIIEKSSPFHHFVVKVVRNTKSTLIQQI